MALVRKILESVLTAGQTSVSFNDSDIPNSLIRVYASKADLFPVKQTLTGNVITIEYEAQSNNVGIALEIVKQGLDIIDDLTTEDNTKALSANQGYVLKGLIDDIVIPTVPENITDLDDVDVIDIANGQVLAWNSTTEKFENVNQSSGGGSINYSTTEQNTGQKWIDGNDIYQVSFVTTSSVTLNNSVWTSVINISGISKMISAEAVRYTGDYISVCCNALYKNNTVSFQVFNTSLTFNAGSVFTIKYTKSS